MKVQVVKTTQNELPKYETPASAGMDIRVDFSKTSPDNPIKTWGEVELLFAGEAYKKTLLKLSPGSRALLPTGIFTAIPPGFEVQLRPRSGLAIKHGLNLINGLGTIDADYRAEWMVPITNQGLESVWIEDGERICQAVLNKVEQIEWEEVQILNESERHGGFGSTGVK